MSDNVKKTEIIDELISVLGYEDKLTDAQKRAVLSSGEVIVSAAAGSGKTSTLVKKIMCMIGEGVSIKNMLVLVYNNAAADELRDRLHNELFRAACVSGGELGERFRAELDNLPFCSIGTIHGFCSSLIKDNFEKLGLSPSFEVLDEDAHKIYENKAFEAVLEKHLNNADDTEFFELAEAFSQGRKYDKLAGCVKLVRSFIEIQPDRQAFLNKVQECYSSFEGSDFFVALEKWYKKFFEEALCELKKNEVEIEGTPYVKYVGAVAEAKAFCGEECGAKSFFEMMAIAVDRPKPELGTRSKSNLEAYAQTENAKRTIDAVYEAGAKLSDMRDRIDDFKAYHSQNAVYVRKIMQLSLELDKILSEIKMKDNVLSFSDLERYAAGLLSEYEDLGVFDCVFVDEYQDVNPTQEFIIKKLIRGECFIVGDVKQSIYGFRLADPTIFLARQRRYESGEGTSISFNRNFRSTSAILSFVNGIFDSVMTKDSADVDYKNTSQFELDGVKDGADVQVCLFSGVKAETKVARGLYDIAHHEQNNVSLSASSAEGKYIARQIKSLVGHAKSADGRYIDYGDIAVLFRSRTSGPMRIIEELKAEGIPVDESGFDKSEERPERELVCMLTVIDNPMQDIPLAGYMLSFFGGYDEDELAMVASCDGECLYDKVKACAKGEWIRRGAQIEGDNNLSQKLARTLETLSTYRTKASFKNVSELMCGIVSDFCYDAYLMREGEADVYAFKAFIASAAEKDVSLGRFLEEYASTSKTKNGVAGGERVSVSTFHGFKGLEIPIVFVADAAASFRADNKTDVLLNGDGYIGIKYFDFDELLKRSTLSTEAVDKLNRTKTVKEEMRLFYVALTRAKQLMYITASVDDDTLKTFGRAHTLGGATCDLDFVSDAICEGTLDGSYLHIVADYDGEKAREESFVLPFDEKIINVISSSKQQRYAFEDATRMAMKYSVSALDGAEEIMPSLYGDGANVGTVYHKVMQFIDFFANGKKEVEAEISKMVESGRLTAEEAAMVDASKIAACLDSEVMQTARQAEKNMGCLRELPFTMLKPACEVSEEFSSKDKVLVQGVIDLFIRGEKNIIVDFKHSSLSDEKLREKYKKQLYLYKSAIESAICEKVDKILLYSFITKHTIEC